MTKKKTIQKSYCYRIYPETVLLPYSFQKPYCHRFNENTGFLCVKRDLICNRIDIVSILKSLLFNNVSKKKFGFVVLKPRNGQ